MKKGICFYLCISLLFTLVSCTKTQPEEPTAYEKALIAIESGEYQKAYDLLKSSEDERAATELEKFAFVPVKERKVVSTGWDVKGDYTYDAAGNLTQWQTKGEDERGNPVSDGWYLYYQDGVLTSEVEQTDVGATTTIYDKQGNLLYYAGSSSVHRCEYDDKGKLMSETWRYYSGGETAYVYTYDEDGRVSTKQIYDDGEKTENYVNYTYHPNGNLKCQEDCFYDEHRIYYYDEEGRFTESYRMMDGEKELLSQKKYDEAGREIYYRETSGYEVPLITETTYNEQGLVTEEKTYAEDEEDEYFSTTQYTYDADGNRLTTDNIESGGYWYKETCTYNAQGNRLTQKTSSQKSWTNETVTYDQNGFVFAYYRESATGSENVTFERDDYGNPIKYTRYRIVNDTETATEYTLTWRLMYYPDGVPEPVTRALAELDNTMWIDAELKIRN
ncbi:MAG: hypothetical protein IKV43_02060 [Clostridia bacterium]|nr:hypothetical protein [Clostridia bacterium]